MRHVLMALLGIIILMMSASSSFAMGCGDVNNNNWIDMMDRANLTLFLYFNGTPPTYPTDANVDGSGNIDNNDLVMLAQYGFRNVWLQCAPPVDNRVLPISNNTVLIQNTAVAPGDSIWRVDFRIISNDNIAGVSLPFNYSCATSSINCDSISYFNTIFQAGGTELYRKIDNGNKKALIAIMQSTNFQYPSSCGLIASAWFKLNPSPSTQYIDIDTTTFISPNGSKNIVVLSKIYECGPYSRYCIDPSVPNVLKNVPPSPPSLVLNKTTMNFAADKNGSLPGSQTFKITNCGDGTLNWSVSDGGTSWLDVSPTSGNSNSQTITVSVNTTNLSPNIAHKATITVSSSNADNSPQIIEVTYMVEFTGIFCLTPNLWGKLTVYQTLSYHEIEPPIVSDMPVMGGTTYCFDVPSTCTDMKWYFYWSWSCGNVDEVDVGIKTFENVAINTGSGELASIAGKWRLLPLGEWIRNNLSVYDSLQLPTLGDSSGIIQYVYMFIDLGEWLANPQPIQESYSIVDGKCAALPGYTIGTSPIVFDSLAGPEENPMQSTPLNGELVLDGVSVLHKTIWICGDANSDEKINLLDVSFIISALYRGGSQPDPMEPADVNHDGKMNLLDVSYIINYLYRGGPAPNCP